MDLVSPSNNCIKMGPYLYEASEKLAADQEYQMLQYYINIIAYTQQLLDMEDLFGTTAN